MMMNDPKKLLDECRRQIDEIDRRIVEALCERGRVVSQVGEVKRAAALPIYAPDRERAVIDRAISRNEGPLSNRSKMSYCGEMTERSLWPEESNSQWKFESKRTRHDLAKDAFDCSIRKWTFIAGDCSIDDGSLSVGGIDRQGCCSFDFAYL